MVLLIINIFEIKLITFYICFNMGFIIMLFDKS